MSSPAVQQELIGGWLEIVITVASNLYVWLCLIFYALGTVLWLGCWRRSSQYRLSFCRLGLYIGYPGLLIMIRRQTVNSLAAFIGLCVATIAYSRAVFPYASDSACYIEQARVLMDRGVFESGLYGIGNPSATFVLIRFFRQAISF